VREPCTSMCACAHYTQAHCTGCHTHTPCRRTSSELPRTSMVGADTSRCTCTRARRTQPHCTGCRPRTHRAGTPLASCPGPPWWAQTRAGAHARMHAARSRTAPAAGHARTVRVHLQRVAQELGGGRGHEVVRKVLVLRVGRAHRRMVADLCAWSRWRRGRGAEEEGRRWGGRVKQGALHFPSFVPPARQRAALQPCGGDGGGGRGGPPAPRGTSRPGRPPAQTSPPGWG